MSVDIPCKSSTTDLINHISFVIDASGSMGHLKPDVIKVFDNQVKRLATMSTNSNQETRVTIYFFDNTIQCVVFDKDVLRLPSIQGLYNPSGQTALMDAIMKSIVDYEKIPLSYGNHASLIFVITDGEENGSKFVRSEHLRAKLASLSDDMTVACLVPNITSEHEAKKYGILKENIIIWDTSCAKGVDEIGANINKATDLFFNNRAAGIKTKHLFKLDTSNLNQDVVLQNLQQLDPTTYNIYDVADTGPIKPYVESITGKPYVIGNVFYRLDKTETIQAKKDIFILEKTTGKVFGGDNARRLLSMPLDQEINVKPDANTLFDIYVESTSVNRKLFKDSKILVIS